MPVTEKEISALREKYPNNIFVFVEKSGKTDLPPLDKHKYIVPKDMTLGSFMFMLRKRITLPPEKAMYLFVGNMLPPSMTRMGELFAQHGSDGYLKITIAAESTFG
jgi:GABA(A) receptor-associated protein